MYLMPVQPKLRLTFFAESDKTSVELKCCTCNAYQLRSVPCRGPHLSFSDAALIGRRRVEKRNGFRFELQARDDLLQVR